MITTDSIVQLYKKTATQLPADVVRALSDSLEKAVTKVEKDTLSTIMENIEKAKNTRVSRYPPLKKHCWKRGRKQES